MEMVASLRLRSCRHLQPGLCPRTYTSAASGSTSRQSRKRLEYLARSDAGEARRVAAGYWNPQVQGDLWRKLRHAKKAVEGVESERKLGEPQERDLSRFKRYDDSERAIIHEHVVSGKTFPELMAALPHRSPFSILQHIEFAQLSLEHQKAYAQAQQEYGTAMSKFPPTPEELDLLKQMIMEGKHTRLEISLRFDKPWQLLLKYARQFDSQKKLKMPQEISQWERIQIKGMKDEGKGVEEITEAMGWPLHMQQFVFLCCRGELEWKTPIMEWGILNREAFERGILAPVSGHEEGVDSSKEAVNESTSG